MRSKNTQKSTFFDPLFFQIVDLLSGGPEIQKISKTFFFYFFGIKRSNNHFPEVWGKSEHYSRS